jgi:hypothetical protein
MFYFGKEMQRSADMAVWFYCPPTPLAFVTPFSSEYTADFQYRDIARLLDLRGLFPELWLHVLHLLLLWLHVLLLMAMLVLLLLLVLMGLTMWLLLSPPSLCVFAPFKCHT